MKLWHTARAWYQKSLAIWVDMRAKGTLSKVMNGEPTSLAALLARSDAAIADLEKGLTAK